MNNKNNNRPMIFDIAEFLYRKVYFESGGLEKNPQPFSISIAVFSYRFGCQKHFFQVVRSYGKKDVSFNVKIQHLNDFLAKLKNGIHLNNLNQNDLSLRNRAIRETGQRIWHLLRVKKRAVQTAYKHHILETTGLGKYFWKMIQQGKNYQISA